jgi:hypothetical protein
MDLALKKKNISYNILITSGKNWIEINSKLDSYNSCESKPTWIDIWDGCGVKAQLSIHKNCLKICTYILTYKCKKLKLKPFQSLSNNCDDKYWVYNMLYTKFEFFSII